jgi:hypothetical protein
MSPLHTTRVVVTQFCIIYHTLSASDGPPGRGEAPLVRRMSILVLARAHFLLDATLLSLDRSPGCARVCSRDLRRRPTVYAHMGARRRCSRPAHHSSTGTPVYPSIIAIIWRLRAATDGQFSPAARRARALGTETQPTPLATYSMHIVDSIDSATIRLQYLWHEHQRDLDSRRWVDWVLISAMMTVSAGVSVWWHCKREHQRAVLAV